MPVTDMYYLRRTAVFDCRGAKIDVWCAHECGARRHTDLVPFGKQELDNRSSTVTCGTCHEDLHDASLGLLRAEALTFRNPEMKNRKTKRGRCVCRWTTNDLLTWLHMLMLCSQYYLIAFDRS